ncbi:MAG: AAA family ATPase [Patescibacteria group bacterium]
MAQTEYNWPRIGNDQVIEFLERSLKNGRIAQTYIFAGAEELGKSTIALAFARNLQGNPTGFNSDLHILAPEADQKGISIEATRQFIKLLNLSSFLNSYKIGVIKEAELLSEEAKNALLKTLEEPREQVVVILLVTDENQLPATILSRSQILYFHPVPAEIIYDYLIENYGANRSLAKDLANLALGRPLIALHLLEHPEEYAAYLEKAEHWLSLPALGLNERLAVLEKFFKDRTWSKQATAAAGELINLAESLSRDLFLLNLGQPERLQHSALSASLEKTLAVLSAAAGGDSTPLILRQLKLLAQAREYLAANVNPRLVLEQIVINL